MAGPALYSQSTQHSVGCLVGAKIYQARESARFERELRRGVPAPPRRPPPRPAITDGGLVGRLEIPRLQVSVMIVEGVSNRDLKRAVGHIPGTALPGDGSNVGIAGHRDTFFRPLRWIRPDDSIDLNTSEGAYRYRVVSTQVVSPTDVQVLDPSGKDMLTLVTCFPFNYIGAAPRRFIVRAERLQGSSRTAAPQPPPSRGLTGSHRSQNSPSPAAVPPTR